jgi:hypothetical protein
LKLLESDAGRLTSLAVVVKLVEVVRETRTLLWLAFLPDRSDSATGRERASRKEDARHAVPLPTKSRLDKAEALR